MAADRGGGGGDGAGFKQGNTRRMEGVRRGGASSMTSRYAHVMFHSSTHGGLHTTGNVRPQCFPHAVWISFTHSRCVKILIHPSHDRVLVCTPSVTLPYQSPASGLTDLCHDRMKSLSFCKGFLLDSFGPRLPKRLHVSLEDSSRSRNVSEVVSVRHVVPSLSSS